MFLEQYVIGEMLSNKKSIKQYLELGLNTSYFQYGACKVLFMDFISNEDLTLESIENRTGIEKFFLVDANNVYNTQMPKLTKKDIVEKLIELKQKEDLKNFLQEFLIDIDVLPISTLQEQVDKIKNYLFIQTKDENKILSLNDILELEEVEDYIQPPYNVFKDYFSYNKGYLITVGSRTSMGKTAFCLDTAIKLSQNHNVLYVNLEMATKSLFNRILSNVSNISLNKLKNIEELSSNEMLIRDKAINKIKKLKLNILNCDNTEYENIIGKIKEFNSIHKQDIIIIDYLTRIQYFSTNRNIEVETIVNKLKELAKELNTCIVVVSQLSREIEKRIDKKPILSDLRDSGGVEQASDVVLLMYRADYYEKNNKNKISVVEFEIAKNRDGETVDGLKLAFNKHTQCFSDIDPKLLK